MRDGACHDESIVGLLDLLKSCDSPIHLNLKIEFFDDTIDMEPTEVCKPKRLEFPLGIGVQFDQFINELIRQAMNQ